MNKTPGQIAFETWYHLSPHVTWNSSSSKQLWEKTAQAVLDAQWRSIDDPPENEKEEILLCGGNNKPSIGEFGARYKSRTHWMPIPKIPKSKDREEFEEWAKQHLAFADKECRKDIAWQAWQAAKASK